jgi:hypothetical protein
MTAPLDSWLPLSQIGVLGLCALPSSRRGIYDYATRMGWDAPEQEGRLWRLRAGRGGGREYHIRVLNTLQQAELLARLAQPVDPRPVDDRHHGAWEMYDRASATKKAEAQRRLRAVDEVAALAAQGKQKFVAMCVVATQYEVRVSTLYRWENAALNARSHAHRLAYLVPRQCGANSASAITPEAWDFFRADYLRLEQPTMTACYRRLVATGAERGWVIPGLRTLERRINAIPVAARVLLRKGKEECEKLYPAQERDRSVFHALEALNTDFHTWDVFVKWPDGRVARPHMIAYQDLYSGKMLSWRVDTDPNMEAVRLAFGDLVQEWGVPSACYMDNGREFAAKWITGGVANRYRFKIRADEPFGLMPQMGVAVHWTTPYHGQSKPIERAFRDFAGDLAKHPAFAGAYTGNSPMAKPENYASTAVPLGLFLKIVGEGVLEHNARVGRRTAVCDGRSFDDVFAESYARSTIARATEAQQRLWLTGAEGVMVSRLDGCIRVMGNRFHAPFLHEHRAEKVVVRFDPQRLQADLHVYGLDGAYLGAAPCVEAVGFNDIEAARAHAQARKAWMRGVKMQAEAEKRLSIGDVAAMLPAGQRPDPVEARVVRPVFPGKPQPAPAFYEESEDDARMDRAISLAAERMKRERAMGA